MRLAPLCLIWLVVNPLPGTASPALDRLAWLAGCWSADGGEPGSVEHWLPPAGGTMLGVSRTIKNGRTTAHEFIQIRATASGSLEYVASPSGQRTAAFAEVRVTDAEAVFENPRHDSPQRIVYARVGSRQLEARIEGTTPSGTKVIRFPMSRLRCDP